MRASGGEQAAEHEREDAAVAEVLALARSVEPQAGPELVASARTVTSVASPFSTPVIENSSRPVRPSASAFSPGMNWSGRIPIISRFERWIRS